MLPLVAECLVDCLPRSRIAGGVFLSQIGASTGRGGGEGASFGDVAAVLALLSDGVWRTQALQVRAAGLRSFFFVPFPSSFCSFLVVLFLVIIS